MTDAANEVKPVWTKADIARMQHAVDSIVLLYITHRPAVGLTRIDQVTEDARRVALFRANARDFIVKELRTMAVRVKASLGRERRAYLRIADRLQNESIPEGVRLPGDMVEQSPSAVVDPASEPTQNWTHPLVVRVDERLAYPVQAAADEQRFVIVCEWRAWGSAADGSTDYDAPCESWHTWAAGVAADLGAAQGWATVVDGVPDGHPASEHVQRILAEAARVCEPPSGVIALDLRGLGLRTVEVLVRALVTAADQRLARDGWVRCGVLLHDSSQAIAYLNRCVRLYADASQA